MKYSNLGAQTAGVVGRRFLGWDGDLGVARKRERFAVRSACARMALGQ
jgi:hypothetical protein